MFLFRLEIHHKNKKPKVVQIFSFFNLYVKQLFFNKVLMIFFLYDSHI